MKNAITNTAGSTKECFAPPFMDQHEVHAIKICLDLFKQPINTLEWGSGNSTSFFSSFLPQGSSWLALEHNFDWYQEVKAGIAQHRSTGAKVFYMPPDKPFDNLSDGDFDTFRNYVESPARWGNCYDFILVDGRARVECMTAGWELLKENGVMVLHDAQREQYAKGIPGDCSWIRIVNPNVWVDGPISTLFMVKQQAVAKILAEALMVGIGNGVQFEMHQVDDITKSAISEETTLSDSPTLTWSSLRLRKEIKLYAGDVPALKQYNNWIGLSLHQQNYQHIKHDITYPFPLPDNSVDAFQSEDVFEHIRYDKLLPVINEIFRVLRPNGLFRLSMPDYGCDVLRERSEFDESGNPLFDPGGGGTRENPGHVWFPRIDAVRNLLNQSAFARHGKIDYRHYYNMDGSPVISPVDYANGHVLRTPDFDKRVGSPYRPMSMIIDLVKTDPLRATNSPEKPTVTIHAVDTVKTAPHLKFMQLFAYYDQYIEDFYDAHPLIQAAGYDEQINALIHDGFSAIHTYAPYMKELGYESFFLLANNSYSQAMWLHENNLPVPDGNWQREIVRLQIESFKPDILYIGNPIEFDSRFVASLSWRPRLIIGWRAAFIPPGSDLSHLDVLLSHLETCRKQALHMGARTAEHFTPGIPPFIPETVRNEPKSYDVVFSGQWTPEHIYRNELIQRIAEAAEASSGGFSLGLFIATANPECLPPVVARHNKGPRWGLEMYRALKSGKIVINAEIDLAHGEAGNMRLFETTGAGAFLLTQHHQNIFNYFKDGEEIATFRDSDELLQKITYFLRRPEERESIAKRGQTRCIESHGMKTRVIRLDQIIRKHLSEEMPLIPKHHETTEDPYDTAYRWGWNNPELRELVYLCYKTPDYFDNARRFLSSDGFVEAIRVLSDMGKPPKNDLVVLDLGCGNGVASYALARAGYKVVGVDSSLGEVAGLNAARKLLGLDGAEFTLLHSTGEALEFPDNSFDIVWMREVLHHIHDLPSFLKEVARILKPGGIICCLREHVIWNEGQREHFFRTHPFYHITKDEGCFYLDEYLEAFNVADLVIEKLFGPTDTVINTYPAPWLPGVTFDPDTARRRPEGNDLFSFFARKTRSETAKGRTNVKPAETGNSVLLDSFNLQVYTVREGSNYLKTGNDCMLGAHFQIISADAHIEIGDRVYISPGTTLICSDRIKFGNDILVAWGCTFIDHDSFPLDTEKRKEVIRNKIERLRQGRQDWDSTELEDVIQGKITIGDNAWIGMNSVIMKGVTIGEGAVIGACSVVTEDVEPWTVVIGNPARRII